MTRFPAGAFLLSALLLAGTVTAAGPQENAVDLQCAASRDATREGDFARGLELARQALAEAVHGSPAEAVARLALGEAQFRAGRLEEAGLSFRRCLHLDPEAAACHGRLGLYLLTIPDYNGAGRALRRAWELDPDDPVTLRRLAGLVTTRAEALELNRRYLELPAVEEDVIIENVKAWVALLEATPDLKLYRLEGPTAAQVPIKKGQGLPWVEAAVNDAPARSFLLDSGASGLSLPASLYHRLELEPVAWFTVRGLSGVSEITPFVLVSRLTVGPFVLHNVPAVVTPSRSSAPAVIGLSLLAPLVPALQADNRLRLDREAGAPDGCPRGDWWRMRPVGGMLMVDATLQGKALRMVFDTGAGRSVVARAALRRHGIKESAGGSITGLTGFTGAADQVGRIQRRGTLSFLGSEAPARGMAVVDLEAMSRSSGAEIDGILGMDLLGKATYQVDYGAGRLRVQPQAGGG